MDGWMLLLLFIALSGCWLADEVVILARMVRGEKDEGMEMFLKASGIFGA